MYSTNINNNDFGSTYNMALKIKLDISEIPDDIYNALLMEFVKKAIIEGIDVPRGAKVEDWNLTAEIELPVIH